MKKILVVDDDLDFLYIIRMMLKADDYEVVTASSGREGLAKATNEKFDAILLDIRMPDFNGIKVLELVRKRDKKLPVFILTTHSDMMNFKLSKRFDASGFIVKTGDLSTEIRNIKRVLGVAERYKGKQG